MNEKLKERLKRIEEDPIFGLIALFSIVLIVGFIYNYSDFKNRSIRDDKTKKYQLTQKAKITDIMPVNHLSMHFDGNKVYTTEYRISYTYKIHSKNIDSKDDIKKEVANLTQWNRLKSLKIGDSIIVKVDSKNLRKSIIQLE